MKGRVKNIIMASFFATMLVFITGRAALAEYHHVDGCTVCHDMSGGGNCGDYTNLRLIYCDLSTPNSGIKTVKFTCDFSEESPCDPEGTNSYADGDAIYDGVCEVCHTNTRHHRNDGNNPDPDPHYAGQYCIACHPHSNEFSHGGGAGTGCESCHGHDAGYEYDPVNHPGELSEGAGTYKSHSTHTENDSDDLKGPNIACGACHDTANYPYFKSGTDGDGNGVFDLSETDVCNTCHSPLVAFDGVNDPASGAKTNWADGIYKADGITLKSGKEKWCAGCHDNQPAYSKPEPVVIIVDNLDPGASYTGTWGTSNWATGYYGSNYHYHTAGVGTDKFTWTPTITTPGTYTVYGLWTQDPSRAPNATYTIYHDGGNTPVSVDQRSNGGTWVFLGAFSFDGVGDKVELVQSASGYVIADAIKWESGIQGTYAPNVIGDNTTYGFYVTGHKINCLKCHDANRNHIDGKHRTYDAGATPYSDSYRLKEIDGQPAMNIPRPKYPPATNPLLHWEDFALCFHCHNRYEVLSQTPGDVSHTNFWNNDASIGNSHNIHLGIYTNHFDSDWNGVADSTESCIACHNVHGSPTQVMIRHGELISTPGTTDKVPALNFSYYPEATLEESEGGKMNYVGAIISQNGVCRACHGPIAYSRPPFLGPKVLSPEAYPETVTPDGSTEVLFTVATLDHDDNLASVIIDLSTIGGNNSQAMFDDGTNGDNQAGDGVYSYNMAIPVSADSGIHYLFVTATDDDALTGENTITLTVLNPGVIIVDNLDIGASYTGEWLTSSWAPGYYRTNYHYHKPGTSGGTDTFTWPLTITTPGTYEVFARWTQDPSRAPDATYTIYHDWESTPVAVDQRSNGGQWVYLGTYDFDGTNDYIELVQSPNGYVIADAIKWERQP